MVLTRTFTSERQLFLRRKHATSQGYGTHRHLYLHDTIRRIAAELAPTEQRPLSLFDYGCGKGRFMEEMGRLRLFADIVGYDPGVVAYEVPPAGRFDMVTCLDVLDAAEHRFRDAVVEDVAGFIVHRAVFDCLTKPKPKSGFAPHPPLYWISLVQKRMQVIKTEMHFLGLDGFERAVIIARPLR